MMLPLRPSFVWQRARLHGVSGVRAAQPLFAWWMALLLLLVAPGAWAQKRMALVIGNGDYLHESKLGNPANDARLIGQTLRSLGFSVDERFNLPQRDMTLAIARFVRESAGADTAVLYYAGHGVQPLNGGRNYLLPIDANIDSDDALDADAIPADRIVEQLERQANPARVRLVVLDACRNNRQASRARSDIRGLVRMAPADDYTLIAFSTEAGQVALDGKGRHSPYAEALSRHLARARELPLRRVFELTASDVRVATKQQQKPRTYGDLDSRVGLDGQVMGGAGSEQFKLEDEAWALCRNGRTVIPCQQYLEAWPQGRYASLARTRIRDLEATAAPVAQVPAAVAAPAGLTVGQVIQDCDVCPKLVVLPAGRFQMGSMDGDPDERPVREVSVAGFLMGQTEVTQGQWRALMGSNPSHFKACGDDCPVEQVSWEEAQAYVKKLSERTGKVYRLPSEAEWEYAARAGSRTKWSFGDDEAKLGEHAWFGGNSGSKTLRVATRRPNGWGLYDMHGNVWEWVQDVWHDDYTGAPTDGSAWMAGGEQARRVLRGGSWGNTPRDLRSADRGWNTPANRDSIIGFRIARTF